MEKNNLFKKRVPSKVINNPRKLMIYKKKVNKRFNYTLKLKDVFDTGGFNINTDQLVDLDADDIFDSREVLIAENRRGKRNLSVNFEYRFGDFQKKKYKREEQKGYNQSGGMDVGF